MATPRTPNDQSSDVHNPNSAEYKAKLDNGSRQQNSKDDKYTQTRQKAAAKKAGGDN